MHFDRHHHELDNTVFGATGEIAGATLCISHGSVVVCGSFEAMREWVLKEHNEEPAAIEPAFYGEMIFGMLNEGFSLHMDSVAALEFMRLLSSDQRFRPEILHFENDGWTTFTPSFNPNRDSRKELARELDAFVLGHLDMDPHGDSYLVRGLKSDCNDPAASPIRFIDYCRLDIAAERLDENALSRLESMCSWITMADGDHD